MLHIQYVRGWDERNVPLTLCLRVKKPKSEEQNCYDKQGGTVTSGKQLDQ